MSATAATICFFACHTGPAEHFADFAERLVKEGHKVEVCASALAAHKFINRKIPVPVSFTINADFSDKDRDALAANLVAEFPNASVVITDVGHVFDKHIQKALAALPPQKAPLRLAYYDNPKVRDVPGDYWTVAAAVMPLADRVIFANADLESAELGEDPNKPGKLLLKDRIGLGYFPLVQAEDLTVQRVETQAKMRAGFFKQHFLQDNGQKILVYFGGNNSDYFEKAFPAFVRLLSEGLVEIDASKDKKDDLSNIIIVLEQHPGAKEDPKSSDKVLAKKWIEDHVLKPKNPTMVISRQKTSDAAQVYADGVLYYQTTLATKLALADVPTLQVGHEKYEDVLVKNKISPSVTRAHDLVQAIVSIKPTLLPLEKRKALLQDLGMKEEWFEILKRAFAKEFVAPSKQKEESFFEHRNVEVREFKKAPS